MLPTINRGRRTWAPRSLPGLHDEMNRLFENFFDQPGRELGRWTPPADLYESDEEYVVEMELPGFTQDDIDVTIEQGILTISGRRETQETEEDEAYHLRERSVGRFSRSFSLPSSINADAVNARFENGVLRVDLPKAIEAKPRKIEVDVG